MYTIQMLFITGLYNIKPFNLLKIFFNNFFLFYTLTIKFIIMCHHKFFSFFLLRINFMMKNRI